VTEISANTYQPIPILSGAKYAFRFPAADRYYASQLWIASLGMFVGQGSVTAIATS
jgi:hypothetical protein